MLHLSADGLSFTLPAAWHELSLGQFLALSDITTDADLLGILSGIDTTRLRALRTPDLSHLIATQLNYLTQDPDFDSLPVPTRLTINQTTITPPTNLGTQTTFGQKVDLDGIIQAMTEAGQPVTGTTTARAMLTIYLYPLVSGQPYDSPQQADSILPLIDALPVTEAIPLAAFFLTSWKQTMPSGRLSWQHRPRPKMPSPGRLRAWWRALIATIRTSLSLPLPRPTASPPPMSPTSSMT